MVRADLIEAQQQQERRTLEKGIKRHYDRAAANASRQGMDKNTEVQKLIRGAAPILAQGVTAWIDKTQQAKGRKPAALAPLESLPPETVALIGMTSIFRSFGKGGRVVDITEDIGRRIEIELEGAALEEADPKAAKRFLKLAEGGLSEKALEDRFRRLVDEHEAALLWTRTHQVLVGQAVLNIALVELRELFVSEEVREKGGKTSYAAIDLTDEAAQALAEMEDVASLQHLPLRPMVSPPRPWESMGSGAYYDFRLSRLVPMVRTRSKEQKKLIAQAIEDGSMAEVLTALNAIQDTKWAIDERVLLWVKWTRSEGLRTSKSFPATEQPELPARADPEAWEAMSKEERSARSRKSRSIREVRKAISIDVKVFAEDIQVADELAEHEGFYMPHSLDFRGRTYAVPYFNHQRSDHMKGLFRFAEGVELGEHGGKWLMIHLANCGDFGKVSKEPFDVRIAWVQENAAQIIAAARAPDVFYDWWSTADSPFCFLQACFEYEAWASTGYSPSYRSTIAGAADGSCSGLQHYSAITRSAEEAHHVNLTPREDVGDIYKVVASVAAPTLQMVANRTDPTDRRDADTIKAAQVILENGFGRSEVKRNVMTYFYGSARFGMRDQHMMDLMRPLADQVALGQIESHPYAMLTERTNKETGELTEQFDGGYLCASTMAAHVYAGVTTVAAKADEASQYIQAVAALLAHESLSMVWRTQTGMPVVQRYSEYTTKAVNLWLYDRSIMVPTGTDKTDDEGNVLSRVRVIMRQAPTTRVDKKTMRNAASPNVIHSMDAAHLHRAVAMAKAAGIDFFAMIHDSFGTHLGKMEQFNLIIRQAFVSCYEDYCPLRELDAYARSVLSEEGIEKLPALPERGNLDLNLILESLYAFA